LPRETVATAVRHEVKIAVHGPLGVLVVVDIAKHAPFPAPATIQIRGATGCARLELRSVSPVSIVHEELQQRLPFDVLLAQVHIHMNGRLLAHELEDRVHVIVRK